MKDGGNIKEKILAKLKDLVDEKRYRHSLLVASDAEKLAKVYKVDSDKAYLVGLTHDIAKNFSDEENLYWVNKYKLDKNLLDESYRKLIHADIGAVVVKEWFNFDDEMCSAIKYHTIAHSSMTTFEKIIFLADKIGRSNLNEELEEVKRLAYQDLDAAMLKFLETERVYLNSLGKDLYPETKILMDNLRK